MRPRRLVMLLPFMLVVACREEAAAAPTDPPAETVPVAYPSEPDPDPDPPFDFRRAILHPERHIGVLRTCIVSVAADAPPSDPNDPPSATPTQAHYLRCSHARGAYEVRALLGVAAGELEIAPAPPIQLDERERARRLSLRIVGIDESRRRPIALVEASRLVLAPPAPPPPPSRAAIEASTGFDFGRAAREPAALGTRRSCVIRAASYVIRASVARGLPEDVVVTIPATCVHAGGRSSAELLFTEETVDHALTVGPGAIAHGIVEPSRHLRVIHVTPSDR